MKAVQFSAQLNKIATRVDGSISVTIETQELNGMDMAELFSYRNCLGYVTFTPNAESIVEVPKENVGDMGKSPAQRLRSVLFIAWKQSDKKFDTFQQYYDVQMERIINTIKDRLDEN
jgi:hypothetical protein